MVGALAAGLASGVWHESRGDWHALPGSARAYALLDAAARAAEAGGDLGDVSSRLVLEAFAPAGIVVVDPRLPAFRRAALPLYELAHPSCDGATRSTTRGRDRISRPARGSCARADEFALFEADGAHRKPRAEGGRGCPRARARH